DVREALQGAGRGTTCGGRALRDALASVEIALALALVIVMTMLAKSFANVQAVELGFEPSRVLSARVTLPAKRYNTAGAIVAFHRALAGRLAALPSVAQSAAISILPLSGVQSRVPFTVEGRSIERERVPAAQFRMVSAGYFATMGIPLKRGRSFSDADTDRTRSVAVVSEALARQWLVDIDPIGSRLLIDDNDGPPRAVEIVGVVGDVPQLAVDAGPTWDIYLPYTQIHADNVAAAAASQFWIIRTPGEPSSLSDALAREIRRTDPEIAAAPIRPMGQYVADSLSPRRFSVLMMAAFGLAALLLALTGVYAVTNYSVGQRSREIAIRMALGATRWQVVQLIARDGGRAVVSGIATGIALTFGFTRWLSTLLFGMGTVDAATFVEAALIVAAASFLACVVPTARAAR